MKIGEFEITRHDERNLVVNRNLKRIAMADTKHHNKGDEYDTLAFIGYYPDLKLACRGVLKHECLEAVTENESLDVISRIQKAEQRIAEALKDLEAVAILS